MANRSKDWKKHENVYMFTFPIAWKLYFLRIFQLVFFVLPIMQYNFFFFFLLLYLSCKYRVRYINFLDLMIFNRAMEKTISSCKLGK